MPSKPWRAVMLLGAAFGIPYAWFNPHISQTVQTQWRETRAAWSGRSWFSGGSDGFLSEEPSGATSAASESKSLEEFLRFDVTPRWVLDQWPRVSTVRAEQDLEGLRAPLVTGTELTDVAGSLTYYFDATHRLRRITLQGVTGDERKLVEVAEQAFHLRPEPALGPGLYVARWNSRPTSVLRITHAPIIRAQHPNERLEFMLEVNYPDAKYELSSASKALLAPGRFLQL